MTDGAADRKWLDDKSSYHLIDLDEATIEAFLERVAIRVESDYSVNGSRTYTFLEITGKNK